MSGYSAPAWANNAAPAINASALTNISEALELSEHPYGVCGTAAGTAAKTVTVDFSGTLTLFTGLRVTVKFTYINTASSPTLNVNSTGDIAIYQNGAAIIAGAWSAGAVLTLFYDGTNWVVDGMCANQVSVTLTTSWSGSGPYTQTVTVTGMTTASVALFDIAGSATSAQRAAARAALLYVTSQANGSITVTADGTLPSVSIPCVVTFLR